MCAELRGHIIKGDFFAIVQIY